MLARASLGFTLALRLLLSNCSCVLEDFLADSRYANKLIKERGLALSVYDILTAEDGRVTWGNGQMYYKGGYSLQREAS